MAEPYLPVDIVANISGGADHGIDDANDCIVRVVGWRNTLVAELERRIAAWPDSVYAVNARDFIKLLKGET